MVGEVDDIMTAIRLVSSGLALTPLPVYLQRGLAEEFESCAQILPGQIETRYGMFFDERRFNLRAAMDIFELFKSETMHVPLPSEATRMSVAIPQ